MHNLEIVHFFLSWSIGS